jgi:hypothetical protein
MEPPFKIVRVGDVLSIHFSDYGETIHPAIGPAAEAEALYVRQLKLRERFAETKDEFVIWDIGLGAAANALGVLHATKNISGRLRLISFDNTIEPIRFALQHASELGYFSGYEEIVGRLISADDKRFEFQNGRQPVSWELHVGDFPALMNNIRSADETSPARKYEDRSPVLPLIGGEGRGEVDHLSNISVKTASFSKIPAPRAILFDPFSPKKNPAMWTQSIFNNLFRRLDPKKLCSLATYSRSTMTRVSLLLAGFFVGVGEATGAKEETTIAANTLHLIEKPLCQNWLERARISTSAEPLSEGLYRQAPLSPQTWEKLRQHSQFS